MNQKLRSEISDEFKWDLTSIYADKKEFEKATRNLNNEMDEAAEEFYNTKKSKEKDDGLSL